MYVEVRNDLQSLDLLLFSGKGVFSHWIKRFTRSKWSHVALVLRQGESIFCFESTTLNTSEGNPVKGVQVNLLSQRLKNYTGLVTFKKLNHDLSPRMVDQKLYQLRKRFEGVPYEQSLVELAASALKHPLLHEDLDSLFCSELVAEVYQEFGFLNERIPSNSYTPEDLSKITLRGGASFGPITVLKDE